MSTHQKWMELAMGVGAGLSLAYMIKRVTGNVPLVSSKTAAPSASSSSSSSGDRSNLVADRLVTTRVKLRMAHYDFLSKLASDAECDDIQPLVRNLVEYVSRSGSASVDRVFGDVRCHACKSSSKGMRPSTLELSVQLTWNQRQWLLGMTARYNITNLSKALRIVLDYLLELSHEVQLDAVGLSWRMQAISERSTREFTIILAEPEKKLLEGLVKSAGLEISESHLAAALRAVVVRGLGMYSTYGKHMFGRVVGQVGPDNSGALFERHVELGSPDVGQQTGPGFRVQVVFTGQQMARLRKVMMDHGLFPEVAVKSILDFFVLKNVQRQMKPVEVHDQLFS